MDYDSDFMSKEDIIREFRVPEGELDNARIYYAKYRTGGYEGSAFVLYEKDGKLYEVHGSHCSCNGLEDWQPEETTMKDLEFRWFQKDQRPYVCNTDEDIALLRRIVLGEMFEQNVLN